MITRVLNVKCFECSSKGLDKGAILENDICWPTICFIWLTHRLLVMPLSTTILPCSGQIFRTDSRLAPSQWETALLCNDISYWLGTNPESALYYCHTFMSSRNWLQAFRNPIWNCNIFTIPVTIRTISNAHLCANIFGENRYDYVLEDLPSKLGDKTYDGSEKFIRLLS